MAETVKRMKEQLQCSICLSTYSEPKQLQCNHVFCRKCLERLRGSFRAITCPTCRQPTVVPASGVAEFQPAFHIQSMLEVIASGEQEIASGAVESCHMPGKTKLYCPIYEDREAELYCETCEQLICYKCVAKGSDHHSHEYRDVSEACEGYMTEMKEGVAVLKKLCGEVFTQQAAIRAHIQENAQEFIAKIKNAKTTELDKLAHRKLELLNSQIQEVLHMPGETPIHGCEYSVVHFCGHIT